MALGAYYHGAAGDLCAKRLGEYGMTPSDLVQALPEILKEQEE
jgi:NAD(P)H-hydrate epimerase